MKITRLVLENWKNFRTVDIALGGRSFFVGPNASGKSNLLDSFRFMADLVKRGGGLQRALSDRGGLQKIRCLAARATPSVVLEFELERGGETPTTWKYRLVLKQERSGAKQNIVAQEQVWEKDKLILDRPNAEDLRDDLRLTQTSLEQISANGEFRAVYDFFGSFRYLHIVPQVIKTPEVFSNARTTVEDDVYGIKFLEQVARTTPKVRASRLARIQKALQIAVPQLGDLQNSTDETGTPHLEVRLEHWRPNAGRQQENQLSDGTLRLIGILWTILETKELIMLEEPELSLHPGIVSRLAPLMYRVNRTKKETSQILVSTHSPDLLSDKGIGMKEVFILSPGREGTTVKSAADIEEVRVLMETGASPADAVIPYSAPNSVEQLNLFE